MGTCHFTLDCLPRRPARARRLVATSATASPSVSVLPRFWRCARASAVESLYRTTLPPTTAVAYMTPAYPKRATTHAIQTLHFARVHASFVRTLDACSESGCHPHGSTVPSTQPAVASNRRGTGNCHQGRRRPRPDKQRQNHVHVLAARRSAIEHAAALASRTEQGTRNRDVNDPVGAPGDALARRGRGRSRLGSVPALTQPLTGAAQNAAPFDVAAHGRKCLRCLRVAAGSRRRALTSRTERSARRPRG